MRILIQEDKWLNDRVTPKDGHSIQLQEPSVISDKVIYKHPIQEVKCEVISFLDQPLQFCGMEVQLLPYLPLQ